jgi:hypothetical protein
MRKLIFLIVFMPLIAHASKWTFITKNVDGWDYYIDSQSRVLNGNEVSFWTIVNFDSRNQFGDLSNKVNQTINCRTRELRLDFFISYSDFDAKGSMTRNFKVPQEWNPIPPDTVNAKLLNFVCKK